MTKKLKKTGLIRQFIYNIMATALPTIVLQLVILPLIAQKLNGDAYGLVLTIIATVMMFAAGIGNVLNNVRMLSDNEYKEKGLTGDFGILFIIGIAAVNIITIGSLWYYEVEGFMAYVLTLFLANAMFTKEYYIVRFWIDLDYFRILICNLICVAGYIVGLGIFWLGGEWQYTYIIGNVASLIYILKKYSISKPFWGKTTLLIQTSKMFCVLTISTILNRALQYVDRLLLYPMLGGEEVSVYYVSTLIGKTISIALGPVNTFLLSQLAKRKKMGKAAFWQVLGISTGLCAIAYCVCLFAVQPLLSILYPQWVEQSMHYVPITTVTAMLTAASMVISPIVLRFCNVNWQIVINGLCFIIYVAGSLILLNFFGLMGFCVGGMLANMVSLCLMIVIYLCTYKEMERD